MYYTYIKTAVWTDKEGYTTPVTLEFDGTTIKLNGIAIKIMILMLQSTRANGIKLYCRLTRLPKVVL